MTIKTVVQQARALEDNIRRVMKNAIANGTDPTGELVVCIMYSAHLAERLAKLSPDALKVIVAMEDASEETMNGRFWG